MADDRTSGGNYVNHDIRSNNGKYILMPPYKAGQSGWGNIAIPNVQEAGGDTTALYPINTKFVDFDRTFIYGYTATKYNAAVKSNLGMWNENTPIVNCTWGGTAGVASDTVCPFLTSSLTGHTTVVVNHFAGGYMMPRTSGIAYGGYRIVSNTVFAGGADATTETDFVIEEPGLQAAVTADAAYCHLSRNPYTAMRSNWLGPNTFRYSSVSGVTLIDPTASTYQWVQTWGPIQMLGDENAGKTVYSRVQYFAWDGTLLAAAGIDFGGTATQNQLAGTLLDYTYIAAAGVYGALLRLEIDR